MIILRVQYDLNSVETPNNQPTFVLFNILFSGKSTWTWIIQLLKYNLFSNEVITLKARCDLNSVETPNNQPAFVLFSGIFSR